MTLIKPTTRLHVYQVETTNACNFRCSFCPTFQPWNDRKTGLVTMHVLEHIDWSSTSYTELQMGGEPTIHPKLGEIIDWLHGRGVKVGFSTNASFPDRLNKVIDRVDILTVNDDEFRHNRMYDGRANVYVQHLGRDYPILDYTRTKLADTYPTHCATPWSYVSVLWNGDVVPCCMDQSGINVLGNVLVDTWQEIEHGPRRKAFLDKLVSGKPNGICEYCTAPNPHQIHEKLLARLDARQQIAAELVEFSQNETDLQRANDDGLANHSEYS